VVARSPSADPAALRAHLLAGHTTAEDVGRIAARAGAGKLVLTHLVPADEQEVADEAWIGAVRPHFDGEIVVGHDLLDVWGGP